MILTAHKINIQGRLKALYDKAIQLLLHFSNYRELLLKMKNSNNNYNNIFTCLLITHYMKTIF